MPDRPTAPLAPIGRRIDARRLELGLKLSQLAKASDISIEQLRAVRYGLNRPRALTAAALERALRWEPGSVDAIIDRGEAPLPAAGAPAATHGEGRAAAIAAIRLVYSGDDEGDEAAIIAAVKRAFGDDVAVAIMSQDHKSLDQRWNELQGWLNLDAAAQALGNLFFENSPPDNEKVKIARN